MDPALRSLMILIAAAALGVACDRNLEPYDPGEEPKQPDLSRIFPAGAEQASRAFGSSEQPPTPSDRGSMAAGSGSPVRGTIRLAPELEGRTPPDGVLFLIARPVGGGPPLAVKRIATPRFPLEFEIGPEDRMIKQVPFAGPLRLSGSVDGDGNATTRNPGDLRGAAPDPVEPGAAGIEIILDEVLGDPPG